MNKIESKNKKESTNSNIPQISTTKEDISDTLEFQDFKNYLFTLFKTKYKTIVTKNDNKNITGQEYNEIRRDVYELFNQFFESKLAEKDEELMKLFNLYDKYCELNEAIKTLQNKWIPFEEEFKEITQKVEKGELNEWELIFLETKMDKKADEIQALLGPFMINVFNKIWEIIGITDVYENVNLDKKISPVDKLPAFLEKRIIDKYNESNLEIKTSIETDSLFDERIFQTLGAIKVTINNYMSLRDPLDFDVYTALLKQIQNYIDEKVLSYFTKNQNLVLEIENIIQSLNAQILSTFKVWPLVINQQNEESWFREFERLNSGMSTLLVSDEEKFKQDITSCLNELYWNVPYNTMDYFTQTIKNKEESESVLNGKPTEKEQQKKLWDSAFDLTLKNKWFKWDICTWMSKKIEEMLLKKWIKCQLIRFKATRTANDDCSWDWHVWVIIVYKTSVDGKEKLVRLDPWLAISEPIYFEEDKNKTLLKYPVMLCKDNKDRRYCLFITEDNNYTWEILGLQKVNDYEVTKDWENLLIRKKSASNGWEYKELKYNTAWELKDETNQTYRISYNMDTLNKQFPYKMYVTGEKNWENVESVYYMSNEWTVVNFENPLKLELDINHSIINPCTIEKNYFKVVKNLSFIRRDKDWNRVASISYPIRVKDKPIKLWKWRDQLDLYSVKWWWIRISLKGGDIIIKSIKDLENLPNKQLIKLVNISDALCYKSPFLTDKNIPQNDIIKNISNESRENLYNLIYTLLKISTNYESFVDCCGVSEKEIDNSIIDFDDKARRLNRWINVNWREQMYLDTKVLALIKSQERFISLWIEELGEWVAEVLWNSQIKHLRLKQLKRISKVEMQQILRSWITHLNLWIEELGEWVAEVLWNSQIKDLHLMKLKHISDVEMQQILRSWITNLCLWIEELEEWVAEVLWNSQIKNLWLPSLENISKEDYDKLTKNWMQLSTHYEFDY